MAGAGRNRPHLYAEALPTAAFAGNIGIAEAKRLVETFFDKIDLSAINQSEAFLIDDNGHAAIFKDPICGLDFFRIIHHIGEAVAAGFLDSDSEAYAAATRLEMIPDPLSSGFSQ